MRYRKSHTKLSESSTKGDSLNRNSSEVRRECGSNEDR